MPLPLQVQLFDAFLGSQEAIHSILLPDVFSPGGSMNVYIDKFGRVTKLGGYTRTNASAVTMNGTGNAAHVTGLFDYQAQGGGSAALFGLFDDGTAGWQLFKSTNDGSTWSFLYDAGVTAINIRPTFAQLNSNLFICNGKVAPRKWDGSSLTAAGVTRSPTPSTVAAATAGNPLGFYSHKLVSVKNDGTKKAGSVSSTQLSVNSKQITVTWTADADGTVVGYELYRTSGTGGIFYLVSYIDGRLTTTYTDNTADSTLINQPNLIVSGDAPPTTYHCEAHQQRVWWLRTDANPTRAYWSDVNVGDSVYANNYLDLSDSDTAGDSITGAVGGFASGFLMVFTEKAVWRVSGTGDLIGGLVVDWTRTRTAAQTGAVSHKSIVRVPVGARWPDQTGQVQTTSQPMLAYFTPLGDIRMTDADGDRIISYPLKDTIAAFSFADRAKIHAVHDALRKQFIWFFPSTSASECDTAVAWNYAWGAWYTWKTLPFDSALLRNDGTTLLVGEANLAKGGFVYQLFKGTDFDGTAFDATWMSKTLYGQDQDGKPMLSWQKRFRWVDALLAFTGIGTIDLQWFPGEASDTASPINSIPLSSTGEEILSSDGDTLVSADADSIEVAVNGNQFKVLLNSGGNFYHDRGIRIKVNDSGGGASWSLESFALAYQVLTGLKRREQ